jgi:hypothetical protein
MFGTFQEELDEEPVVFGIRGPLHSWNPVRALTHVYVDMLQDSWRAARWRDKFRVWVARTGWQPEDVARQHPRHKADLATFEKYDPPLSRPVAWYAFGQLVAVIVLLQLMQMTDPGYWPGVGLWALLLATTVTTAWWLEARDGSRILHWEWLRLTAVAGALLLAWVAGAGPLILVAGLSYVGLNLLALSHLAHAVRPGASVSA